MNILVLVKGGREHALVRALSFSPKVQTLHCAPGSEGMRKDCFIHDVDLNSKEDVGLLIKKLSINLVIIGPEEWLVKGLSDHIRSLGVDVFGPSKVGAQLEESKAFAKKFMAKASIPTAQYEEVSSVAEVEKIASQFSPPYVFKVDGLAAGKGVSICSDKASLVQAAKDCFEAKKFGESGHRAIVEEFKSGWELSFLVLTNGQDYEPLPLAQDHQALSDGGMGPNTGGMAVVAPLAIDAKLNEEIHNTIIKPTVDLLNKENMDYRGVLFIGLMITEDGPCVIEYNVRFGDPETQVIMPLLDGVWAEVFTQVSQGSVPKLNWKPRSIACVVLAAENYPSQPVKGIPIGGDIEHETAFGYVLHAGTKKESSNKWVTNGGRVLNVVGFGSDQKESVENSYRMVENISWPGMQYRSDIGKGFLER